MKYIQLRQHFINNIKIDFDKKEIENIFHLILENKFNINKTYFLLNIEKKIDKAVIELIDNCITQLNENKPIQYILNESYFYGNNYYVDENCLIPRPETEELVDIIINENKNKSNLRILDVGTGSGIIAITLAKNLENSVVTGIDINNKSLEISNKNAKILNSNVNFEQFNILDWQNNKISDYKYDLIVSNPPYVLNSEKNEIHSNVLDFEPNIALFVDDDDPFIFYKYILEFSKINLNTGGKIYFEINSKNAFNLLEFCKKHYEKSTLIQDMNSKNRFIKINSI